MSSEVWLPALHFVALLLGSILFVGIVNRVKSIWAGRQGPRLYQVYFDIWRLLKKQPVYSRTTSPVVKAGPLVVLSSAIVAGCIGPVIAGYAPLAFAYDFVVFAYVLGLGRMFLMLAALDTGSAFEGMGAAREATYASVIEPAFFLLLGSLGIATGKTSFAAILSPADAPIPAVVVAGGAVVLFILLQVEAARVPVDDPNTHLELTMIHEVMILDHSGPDLAALQYAAALKLFTCAGLIAALLNPFAVASRPIAAVATSLGLIGLVAVATGLVESLIARFRMSVLPRYALVAVIAAIVSLGFVVLARGSVS